VVDSDDQCGSALDHSNDLVQIVQDVNYWTLNYHVSWQMWIGCKRISGTTQTYLTIQIEEIYG